MRRILANERNEDRVCLDDGEIHHLTRVLRVREGETFEAILPPATRCLCRLERETGNWVGRVIQESSTTWESPIRICLVQALIKGDKFEWVIQKAVELGAAEIQPMISCRTEIELTDRRREHKLSRWSRILREAVKQCGRTTVPELHEPRNLSDILAERPTAFRFYPDECGRMGFETYLSGTCTPRACDVFIGPEGGWDDRDHDLFAAFGVASVRLGPRILRTETAAVAALSILQYRLGDLSASPDGFAVDYGLPTQ